MNKFAMTALLAGSLALGVSFANPGKDSLTAEQKAEWAAKREAMKAKHDSLRTANKAEIDARRAAAKAAREAAEAKFKALIDAYKTGLAAAATDAEKAALKEKLQADLKALHAELGADIVKHRGDFRDRAAAHRAEWRGHEGPGGFGGHGDSTRTALTEAQIAELKAKLEAWKAAHPDETK